MKSIISLLSELKENKRLITFILFCGALSSAFKASTASLAKIMGDLIFEQKNTGILNQASNNITTKFSQIANNLEINPLIFTTVLLGAAFILANIFRYIFMYNMRSLAETRAVIAREKLMEHYLTLDAKYKNEISEGSGGLISRILNDVNIFQEGVKKLSDLLKEPFLVIFATIWLFSLNWKVGAFLFLGLPPILLIIKYLAKSLRKHSTRSLASMESVTMTLKEGLDGSRVIHSFNLENKILKRFKSHTQSYLKTVKKIISREELSGPLSESITSIVFCGSFLLIAYLVKTEGLTFGDFFGISVAVGFLTDSAKKTQNAFIRIQQASVAKERINSILNNNSSQKKLSGNEKFPTPLKSIQFKDLSVNISEKNILTNINFTTPAQKTIALIGPSGSGKTSLLNCIDLFLRPTKGDILFNNTSLLTIDPFDLRENISLVSQDPFLFNGTIYENLKLIKDDLTEEEAVKALKLANANFCLNQNEGIHTHVAERGARFSGGERQRISIARAIIKNSPILLLDEATSALDSQSELEVQKGLDSLKSGRTCFVVAHRLSTIKNADTILVFNNGEIVEQGTHNELISKTGLYHRLHSLSEV